MFYALPANRVLLALSGDDAASFLQGLVSNNVSRLEKGEAVYAAMLTPQGKFLHDFFLLPWRGIILLDCDRQSLPDLPARLNMYKLRSKVAIEAMDDMGVVVAWGEKAAGFGVRDSGFGAFPDPRMPQLGWRIAGDASAIGAWCEGQGMQAADAMEYERLRLSLGVPDGARDMIREKSLLLEFGFEDLHGVDFSKGCYVGQEVTARSKYRGRTRRFLYQAQAQNSLPPCGTPVMLDGAPAGELRSSLDGMGLALLNVAMVEKAQREGQAFYAGDTAFRAVLPPWVAQPPKALTIEE